MSLTPSTMAPLGSPAPDFDLPDTAGKRVALRDFADAPALVVVFICNHCPYVKHIAAGLADFARDVRVRNVAVVGISSNDAVAYPDDGPDRMREEVERRGYVFPYLYDADQTVARAYRAACTPDLFVYDAQRKLAYRGQFDDSRPGNQVAVSGIDLRRAVDAVLAGEPASERQVPSMGCNIKWKR